jgi:hypothetical protein
VERSAFGVAEKFFAVKAKLLVEVAGRGAAIHGLEVARDAVDGLFSSDNADVSRGEGGGQKTVQINERDSSRNTFKGSELVLENVVERRNATAIDERGLEHGGSVVSLRKGERRHVEHSAVDLGISGDEAGVLLIHDAKNMNTGLKRGGLDCNFKRGEYVGRTYVGGNVFLKKDSGIGSHGRRRTSHVDAYYLTSCLVDVDGAAHTFFVLDAAESEVGFKRPIGVVHWDHVGGDLPGRSDVGLNRRGSGVSN